MKFTFLDNKKAEKKVSMIFDENTSDEADDMVFKEVPDTLPERKEDVKDLSFFGDEVETDFSREYLDLKVKLHQKIIDKLNLSALDKVERPQAKKEISVILAKLLEDEDQSINTIERARLADEILDELLGFGPLEPLLADPTVSDILVNSPSEVFVERRGRLEETDVSFSDDDHLMRIIDRIVTGVGRRIDESTPLVLSLIHI